MMKFADEAQYQDAIAELARMQGWLVFHPRRSQTGKKWLTAVSYDGVGFPDLVMIHPLGYQLVLEVKSATGRVSHRQTIWRAAFSEAADTINSERYIMEVVWPQNWGWVQDQLDRPRRSV